METTKFTKKEFKNEQWKPVLDYEDIYEVSNLGRVRSLDRYVKHSRPGTWKKVDGRILHLSKIKIGYFNCSLSKNGEMKSHYIHRLVGQAFLPNPKGYTELNHLDGDKSNNRLENLEWCSRSHNMRHAFDNGLMHRRFKEGNKGEDNLNSKLTESDVIEIRRMWEEESITQTQIANKWSMSPQAIHNIIRRKNWKHI